MHSGEVFKISAEEDSEQGNAGICIQPAYKQTTGKSYSAQ